MTGSGAPRARPAFGEFLRQWAERLWAPVAGQVNGRVGLRRPTASTWGMMRLRTIGRRTGEERAAILGYHADCPNLVTLAMNGWGQRRAGLVAQPSGMP